MKKKILREREREGGTFLYRKNMHRMEENDNFIVRG